MMPGLIRCRAVAPLLFCLLLLTSCSTPVGVNRISPFEGYKAGYINPMSAGVPSEQVKYVLNRNNLLKKFENDPETTIARLHEKALRDNRRDILYALAEVSYLYADRLGKSYVQADLERSPDYFLLSAIYSYFFMISERSVPPPTHFDHRARNALDLYNFGLWQGLATGEGGKLEFTGGVRKLPFGELSITLDCSKLHWGIDEFEKFEPADSYEIRGVTVRNRTAGIGLPLIGSKRGTSDAFSSRQVVPITAFMRINGDISSFSTGKGSASLELYSAEDNSTIIINNRTLPLETDLTAPLAYKLEDSEIWGLGLNIFLGRDVHKPPDGLYLHEPYRPGRIPVVFVHGTASSAVWWTEMFNTLHFDPMIRRKYQFWHFAYTSSQPIINSAADLRDALRKEIEKLDPEGRDPALRQMVVIGHSQGGLLTKLAVVDAGENLVKALTGKDMASLKLSDEDKARTSRLLVVEPLPFVKQVVFLSTPHRGSFLSGWWSRNLVKMLVTLPASLVQTSVGFYDYFTDDVKKLMGGKKSIFTSADSMSPDNPLLKSLAAIPLAPWVKGHSIIAVKGEGDPKLGNDGVVEYTSAHLDGMDSEFIVQGGHSTQLNPLAIDEVRRILIEHLAASALEMVELK